MVPSHFTQCSKNDETKLLLRVQYALEERFIEFCHMLCQVKRLTRTSQSYRFVRYYFCAYIISEQILV